MKRIFTSLVLALSIFTISSQRSHAVVGLATANPTIAALGGLAGVSSMVLFRNESGSVGESFVRGFWALIIGAVGVTLLDEKQEAEILFSAITSSTELSAKELSIYNSELLELNSIHQTITAELKADPKLNAKELWDQYSYALSPETLEVAQATAKSLFVSLKK